MAFKRGWFIFVACILFFTTIGMAATCYCNSCNSCTAALDNPTCTKVVLTQDVQLNYPAQICINNPVGFRNKVFDCQGHAFLSPYRQTLTYGQLTLNKGTFFLNSSYTNFNDKIINCRFVNTSTAFWISDVGNISIVNTSGVKEHALFFIEGCHNISINNIILKDSNALILALENRLSASILPISTNAYTISLKNAKVIRAESPVTAPFTYEVGTIYLFSDDNMFVDNVSFINCTNGVSFTGDGINSIEFSRWYDKNSTISFWTWDMYYSSVTNFNTPDLRFDPIYTWNHDYFINITAAGFAIWSSASPFVSSTIVANALAYTAFKNIKVKFFYTNYAYKTNFTNITVENGGGFRIQSYSNAPSYYSWSSTLSQLRYLIPWGNRFINITLVNNTPYDFSVYVIYHPYLCQILAHNTFKNIVSNGGRPILITSSTYQTITGKYAEIYACLNDSTLKDVDVEASPSLNNDGIYLADSYRDVFVNVNSSNNYIGVAGNTYSLRIINSSFNSNQVGCQLSGNLSASNTHFDRNKQYGLATRWLKNSKFVNDSFVDNKQYDIYPISSAVTLPFSLSVCDGSLSFKNEKLSGNRGLGIFNTSTTYKNKQYAEAIVCGKNILLNNITILGNKNLKNDGLLVLNSSYVSMSNIKADDVYQGVLLYYSNHTTIVNSTFSNDQTNGVKIYNPISWVASLLKWVNKPGYNTLQNITAEYDDIGVYLYSSSNTLNNISACFDKKVSFYFAGSTQNNIGADNTGNVTDLGTNPGFSADAGICYLSLLKPVFVPPTPANNSILSSTSITLNATSSDPTLTNITLNLYNNTGLVKSVVCTSSPCSYSFTGLKLNQNYYFNATACDAEKQCASTGTYTTYLSPTTCALVLVVKNHLNKALYIDAVKIGGEEYDVGHALLLPYQSKAIRIENNGFCQYLGRVVFLDMTIYFSDSSHMTYEVSGEVALNS